MSAGRDTPSLRAVSLWFRPAESNSAAMMLRSKPSTRARSGWLGPGSPTMGELAADCEGGSASERQRASVSL